MALSNNQKTVVKFALFACFAGTTLVFSPNTAIFSGMGIDGASMGRFIFPMFIAATLAAGVVALVFRRNTPHYARNYTVLLAATTLHAAAAALFVAFAYGFSPGHVATAATGVLYGASLVVVCLAWLHVLGCIEFREAILACTLVCVASYALSIGLAAVPSGIRGLLFLVIFFVGNFAPIALLRHEPAMQQAPAISDTRPANTYTNENELVTTSTSNLLAALRLPGIGLVLFAFMMAISKVRIFDTIDAEYFGGFAAALLILPLFTIHTDRPLAAYIYRIVAPTIGAVVIVLLAFPTGSSVHSIAIALVYVFLSALAILAFANILAIVNAGEFPSEFVGSLGLCVGCLVSLAGITWTQLFGGPDNMTPVVFVLIALYCAFMMVSLGWESWKLVTSPTTERTQTPSSATDTTAVWMEKAAEAKLTKRETEILALLGRGHSIIYIAEKLFISESTVRTHVKHIYAKLDIHSKEELFAFIDGRERI